MRTLIPESRSRNPGANAITRREILIGGAVMAVGPQVIRLFDGSVAQRLTPPSQDLASEIALRRHLSAAALLPDGRIVVTGGFSQPFDQRRSVMPLNSVIMLDPVTGTLSLLAPMSIPRARHAAVTLADGRVVVTGGCSLQSTASVEIYDPVEDCWYPGQPLSQPRYDHDAVTDGFNIFVIGGFSSNIRSNVEILQVSQAPRRIPK